MIAAACPHTAIWRIVMGIVTVTVLAFLWIFGVIWLIGVLNGTSFLATMSGAMQPLAPRPGGAALYLFLIVGIGVGTLIAAAFWQKRRPGTLFGPAARTLRHFVISAGLSLTVMIILGALSLPFMERPELNMDVSTWLLWLPLGILVLAAQTGSEELLFRGYLQSQLAARYAAPVVWLLIPSILFGAIHYQPGMPIFLTLTIVIVATVFGILAGDLTARTGSIGAAWGFHFANTALVILLVASEASITGLSLFKTSLGLDDLGTLSPLIAVEVLTLAAIWALIRRVLAT